MSTPARAPSRRPSPRPNPRATPAAASAVASPSRTATARATAPRRDERARPPKEAKARPNLEVVAPERSRTFRLRVLGGVACLLLFGALLGLAVFHSVLVQGQLGLDRMEHEIEAEQELQRALRKDLAALASPERIQAEATARGMVLPNEREYLRAVVPGQVVPPPGAGR
jgi:hypothetical protein